MYMFMCATGAREPTICNGDHCSGVRFLAVEFVSKRQSCQEQWVKNDRMEKGGDKYYLSTTKSTMDDNLQK